MTTSSDTPRTDAAPRIAYEVRELSDGSIYSEELEYIEPEFARELERELTRALRVVEAAKQWLYGTGNFDTARHLAEAVEEWEAGR